MFGLSSLATYAIAAALIFASGALSGWKVESWRWGASELAAVKAAEAERDALQARYTDASRAYEAERARTHVVYKTIYRKADAWVADHPRGECLDALGVSIVNQALGFAPADTGQSAGSLREGDGDGGRVKGSGHPQAGGGGPTPR